MSDGRILEYQPSGGGNRCCCTGERRKKVLHVAEATP